MTTLAAVDIGAQSGRIAVGEFDGERLTITEVHRFANGPIQDGGHLRWDVRKIFDDVLVGLTKAAGAAVAIDAIGVDSWAIDFGLLDQSGTLLANPTHYRDARRMAAVDGVHERISGRRLYDRTGIQHMPINTVFELAAMAVENDPALERAETLLMIPDLLQYWLSGVKVSEFTNATTTQCIDAGSGRWSAEILDALDIPMRMFTDIVQPCTPLGVVAPGISQQTGLGDTQVVAVATHDTGSAVAATALAGPTSAYISAGTWSLVGLEVAERQINDRTYAANLTNEGGIAGTFRLLRNLTGLWLLHECREAWAQEGDNWDYGVLVSRADQAPALVSFIDPDDVRFASPGEMPTRIREFCASTGQPVPEGPAPIVRCVLESIALKHALTLNLIAATTGTQIENVHIVGGGSRNDRLCQWTADAAGLPVHSGPEEATLVGNLLGQAIGLREVASLTEAREVVRQSFAPTTYEPRLSEQWREASARFAALVSSVQLQGAT